MPTVNQETTLPIIHRSDVLYNITYYGMKNIVTRTCYVMDLKSNYQGKNCFLKQAINVFTFGVNLYWSVEELQLFLVPRWIQPRSWKVATWSYTWIVAEAPFMLQHQSDSVSTPQGENLCNKQHWTLICTFPSTNVICLLCSIVFLHICIFHY